jgi:hypothetical protein
MSRYAIPPLIHRHLPRNPSQALDLLPSVPCADERRRLAVLIAIPGMNGTNPNPA